MIDRVVVTGANGFVGRALVGELSRRKDWAVRAIARRKLEGFPRNVEAMTIADYFSARSWQEALSDVSAIVHCAGRAHELRDAAIDPLAEFRRTNRDAAVYVAAQAALVGVKRFVYVSSAGVNGAESFEKPFSAEDLPKPHSPYAQSKAEAEVQLQAIARESGLEVVIVRPPLVYGHGAPGNYSLLLKAVRSGIPLPLKTVRNIRSFVAIENLTDFLILCARHPQAKNQIFLVSDDEDVSTSELLELMANAMGKQSRLFSLPKGFMAAAARMLGKADVARSLFGNLQLDVEKSRRLLDWRPVSSLRDALRSSVA
jgi:UDP-glucose 4-epimerase